MFQVYFYQNPHEHTNNNQLIYSIVHAGIDHLEYTLEYTKLLFQILVHPRRLHDHQDNPILGQCLDVRDLLQSLRLEGLFFRGVLDFEWKFVNFVVVFGISLQRILQTHIGNFYLLPHESRNFD